MLKMKERMVETNVNLTTVPNVRQANVGSTNNNSNSRQQQNIPHVNNKKSKDKATIELQKSKFYAFDAKSTASLWVLGEGNYTFTIWEDTEITCQGCLKSSVSNTTTFFFELRDPRTRYFCKCYISLPENYEIKENENDNFKKIEYPSLRGWDITDDDNIKLKQFNATENSFVKFPIFMPSAGRNGEEMEI